MWERFHGYRFSMVESTMNQGQSSPLAGDGSSESSSSLSQASDAEIRAAITGFVAGDYPCVGARSVFKRGSVEILVLDRLADEAGTARLLPALEEFARAHPKETEAATPDLASFLVVFREPVTTSEIEFEDLLWRQLALLHHLDTVPWDTEVSADPSDPHFGFSVAGRAHFVIGMHPGASRLARRAPLPTLVFNLHSQFAQLRAVGKYDRLRDTVRRRDTELQGSPNPMLADHGDRSEARQYSGRRVPDGWTPPYDLRTTTRGDQE